MAAPGTFEMGNVHFRGTSTNIQFALKQRHGGWSLREGKGQGYVDAKWGTVTGECKHQGNN